MFICSRYLRPGSTFVGGALLQLFAALLPIVQPFADAGLEAAVGRLVKSLPLHLLGPVILAGKRLIGVVVVGIILTVADLLHQLGRSVEDMRRRHERAGLFRASPSPFLGD